jgi:hypothetical protein
MCGEVEGYGMIENFKAVSMVTASSDAEFIDLI